MLKWRIDGDCFLWTPVGTSWVPALQHRLMHVLKTLVEGKPVTSREGSVRETFHLMLFELVRLTVFKLCGLSDAEVTLRVIVPEEHLPINVLLWFNDIVHAASQLRPNKAWYEAHSSSFELKRFHRGQPDEWSVRLVPTAQARASTRLVERQTQAMRSRELGVAEQVGMFF